jgi:hypothetical protein
VGVVIVRVGPGEVEPAKGSGWGHGGGVAWREVGCL